jgi:hypothetical protein
MILDTGIVSTCIFLEIWHLSSSITKVSLLRLTGLIWYVIQIKHKDDSQRGRPGSIATSRRICTSSVRRREGHLRLLLARYVHPFRFEHDVDVKNRC